MTSVSIESQKKVFCKHVDILLGSRFLHFHQSPIDVYHFHGCRIQKSSSFSVDSRHYWPILIRVPSYPFLTICNIFGNAGVSQNLIGLNLLLCSVMRSQASHLPSPGLSLADGVVHTKQQSLLLLYCYPPQTNRTTACNRSIKMWADGNSPCFAFHETPSAFSTNYLSVFVWLFNLILIWKHLSVNVTEGWNLSETFNMHLLCTPLVTCLVMQDSSILTKFLHWLRSWFSFSCK